MAYTRAHADLAARHVLEGQVRVHQLAEGIARAKALGHSTELAEKALATMQVTLRLMIEHEDAIKASRALRQEQEDSN